MYQNFIGIDIGKLSFFVALHEHKDVKEYPNTKQGCKLFYTDFRAILQSGLTVLETTGGYEMLLLRYIQAQGCRVHRANTRKVKHFIRSYGYLGKSDTIDAICLARYGFERHSTLPLYEEIGNKKLFLLVKRRGNLISMLVQEKNRLQAPESKDLRKSFQAVIKYLSKELESIEAELEKAVSQEDGFQEQKDVLKTIPGIGNVVSIQLLCLMPELGRFDRKQIASLGGLAPHPNESGKKVGYRKTRGGRAEIKPVLFIAAMAAARSNSELGEHYKKLVGSGKKKMVALTALMRKILVIANAKMRDHLVETATV